MYLGACLRGLTGTKGQPDAAAADMSDEDA